MSLAAALRRPTRTRRRRASMTRRLTPRSPSACPTLPACWKRWAASSKVLHRHTPHAGGWLRETLLTIAHMPSGRPAKPPALSGSSMPASSSEQVCRVHAEDCRLGCRCWRGRTTRGPTCCPASTRARSGRSPPSSPPPTRARWWAPSGALLSAVSWESPALVQRCGAQLDAEQPA